MKYKSIDKFDIPSGTVYVVLNDTERDPEQLGLLINKSVEINGRNFVVKAVESFSKSGPILSGEKIGLLVHRSRALFIGDSFTEYPEVHNLETKTIV